MVLDNPLYVRVLVAARNFLDQLLELLLSGEDQLRILVGFLARL